MGLLPAVTDVRFKLQPRPNAKLCLHRPWEPTPRLPGPAFPSPGSLAGPRTLRRSGFPNSWAARVCRTAAAKVPTPGLTMSPGQVLRVHQADLLLPGDVTVQSDGEVVGRRNDLLGRQDHGARAAPEDTPVLAVRLLVAGKGVHQHQDAAAPAWPPLLSRRPRPYPCPLPGWAWPRTLTW